MHKTQQELDEDVRVIAPGLYRHYKGGEYEVLFAARHSETLEWTVVYRSLAHNSMWVRPFDMFLEDVEVDGKMVPRFKKIEQNDTA